MPANRNLLSGQNYSAQTALFITSKLYHAAYHLFKNTASPEETKKMLVKRKHNTALGHRTDRKISQKLYSKAEQNGTNKIFSSFKENTADCQAHVHKVKPPQTSSAHAKMVSKPQDTSCKPALSIDI